MASKNKSLNKQHKLRNSCEAVIGQPRERSEVVRELQQSPELYAQFLRLPEQMQEDLIAFCMGVKGLNVTYDRVFKAIFDPAEHPERLEDFLSHCLGKRVKILQVMPNESRIASQEGALASVHRGQHASKRANFTVFRVILSRRTSSTPPSSALKTAKLSPLEVVEPEISGFAFQPGT